MCGSGQSGLAGYRSLEGECSVKRFSGDPAIMVQAKGGFTKWSGML